MLSFLNLFCVFFNNSIYIFFKISVLMDNKGVGMNFVKIIKDRLIKNNGLLVVLSITATLFILGPSNVYIVNVSDFTSSYMYILGEILKLFLYSSIILLFVLMIIPKKIYNIFISLLLGVAVALWVQGLFLTFDYGALDGNTKINAFDIKGIVGAIVWIAIIISAVIFRKFLHKFIAPIFFVIIVSQLAIFIPNLFSNIDNISGKSVNINNNGPISLSNKENIIYIVLDTFDAQFFEEASKDENYKEIFNDFTYFNNYASIDRWTTQSGVAALVGTIYDNTLTMNEYRIKSFSDGVSLQEKLKDMGYINELYTMFASGVYFKNNYSNIDGENIGNNPYEINKMMNASYFKFLPHHFKGNFIVDDIAKLWDYWFIKLINDKNLNRIEPPVFLLIHLFGLHTPFIILEDYSYSKKANEITQTKATGNYLKSFFDLLKENNAYDNSIIIVTGDHGYYDYRSNPTLLIKNRFQTNNEVKVNKTPLSQIQMKDIILKLLNGEYKTTDDIKGMDSRKLYISDVHLVKGYAGHIEEYEIPEEVRDISNYKKTGIVYYPSLFRLSSKDLNINLSNDYDKYKDIFNENWKYSDSAITTAFSANRRSSISLQFTDETKEMIKVTLKNSKGELCKLNEKYKITINNDNYYVDCLGDKIDIYGIYDKLLAIHFDFRYMKQHLTIDNIDIKRGITLKDIYRIPFKKTIPIIELPYMFFIKGWDDVYYNPNNQHGRWIVAEESELQFVLESMPKNDIKISLEASTLNHANYVKPDISFYINDKLIHTDKKGSGFHNKKIDLVVKKEDITDEVVNLKIKYHDKVKTPKEIGINSDKRKLGIYLTNIAIEELDKATIQ